MIEVMGVDGVHAPKMFCDSCGEEIAKFGDGAAVYTNVLGRGERSQVALVHKRFVKPGCMHVAEEKVRRSGRQSGWSELRQFFADFTYNIGLKPSKIKEELERAQM